MLGRALEIEVDGGLHHHVLLDAADVIGEHIHHPIGDVVAAPLQLIVRSRRRRVARGLGLVGRDETLVGHRGEDQHGALVRRLRVLVRRVAARRRQNASERCRLRQRQVARIDVEVDVGGGLDAVGARTEIDPVQIHIQYLVLGVVRLQPKREDHLLHLALQRALGRQEHVLGELLGQRRAALHHAAGEDVLGDGAQKPDRIDAMVGAEAAVFDRDHRVRDVGRQIGERDRLPAGVTTIADQAAVDGKNLDVRRTVGDLPIGGTAKVRGVVGDQADAGERHPDAEHDDQSDGPEDDRATAALARGPLALARLGTALRGLLGRALAPLARTILRLNREVLRPTAHEFRLDPARLPAACHSRPSSAPGGVSAPNWAIEGR